MTALPGIAGPGVTVWPLRSGSSGNCLLVASGGRSILVDAGWRAQRDFADAMGKARVDASRIAGILVTHTHVDHFNYNTFRISEKHGIPIWVHESNWERAYRSHFLRHRTPGQPWRGEKRFFQFGVPFPLADGAFEVEACKVSHDGGTPCGFLVRCVGGGQAADLSIGVVTDLGCWDRRLARFLSRAEFLVVESNWDPEMIASSPRDPVDVARVVSATGHLSNEACAALVCEAVRLRGEPVRGVLLAHLSADHNRITRALATVRRLLGENGLHRIPVTAAPRGVMADPLVLVG